MLKMSRNWNVAFNPRTGSVVQCRDLVQGVVHPGGTATPGTPLALVLDKTMSVMVAGDLLSVNGKSVAFRQVQAPGRN